LIQSTSVAGLYVLLIVRSLYVGDDECYIFIECPRHCLCLCAAPFCYSSDDNVKNLHCALAHPGSLLYGRFGLPLVRAAIASRSIALLLVCHCLSFSSAVDFAVLEILRCFFFQTAKRLPGWVLPLFGIPSMRMILPSAAYG
jgi:hypothetical protein